MRKFFTIYLSDNPILINEQLWKFVDSSCNSNCLLANKKNDLISKETWRWEEDKGVIRGKDGNVLTIKDISDPKRVIEASDDSSMEQKQTWTKTEQTDQIHCTFKITINKKDRVFRRNRP